VVNRNISDEKFDTLGALGYTGALQDREFKYYKDTNPSTVASFPELLKAHKDANNIKTATDEITYWTTRTIGDQVAYAANGYTAWSGPWSTYPGGSNDDLTTPEDYENSIRVSPEHFPNGTTLKWRWPTPGNGLVTGYLHVAAANYDGSYEFDWTPWQVGNITTFTETVDYTLTGDTSDATVLNEFYLTTTSGDETTDAFEIAHWLHSSSDALTWFNTKSLIGTWTDPQGRSWTARNCGANPTGAIYIVFVPSVDVTSGVINKKHALDWLVTQGTIPNYLWVNGTAIGVEPYRGSGSMYIESYSTSFAGSGSVIPAGPTNRMTNGNFASSDTGWTGFWFSGKTVDTTNQRAVWGSGSVAFDGINQAQTFTAGKYYQVEYTINRTAGEFLARFTGGTNRNGATRTASGTYKERLLANTGNNRISFDPGSTPFQGWLDDIKLYGPYDTSTIDGS
jgi:hypothetical protein